jgi:hypothetical protein
MKRVAHVLPVLVFLSCVDLGKESPQRPAIASDADLWSLIAQADPYSEYRAFPRADSVTTGTLNGSSAHRPAVSVGLNAVALGALRGGNLPEGTRFPEGSIIVKRIIVGDSTTLLAVVCKEQDNPHAGNGWLWAEFYPGGIPFISVQRGGADCTGCHLREEGSVNDLIRTFERQH